MYGPVAAEAFQTLHVHGRVLIAAECQHIRIADEDNLAAAVRIEEFQDIFKQSSRSETEQVGLRQAAVYKVCLMNYEQRPVIQISVRFQRYDLHSGFYIIIFIFNGFHIAGSAIDERIEAVCAYSALPQSPADTCRMA